MTAARRCRVVLLWHMHQPSYRSPVSGQYVLPWVLMHALRDYHDMPALAAGVEGTRPVFNLVPGLLKQIRDYETLSAPDNFLLLALKDPPDLSPREKQFLLDNFFVVQPETMLKPYRRYSELADKARTYVAGQSGLPRFSNQELADLQVWFFLTWSGRTLRKDERVKALFAKGRDFSREDKELLRDAGFELLRRIVPLHRELVEQGRIEVSASPMYHPILPLLINTNSAREAVPDIQLPAGLFAFPEDAAWHVEKGLKLVSDEIGRPVVGMWPSEGSVSTEALKIMGGCGVKWIATDEKLLHASLGSGPGDRTSLVSTPWVSGDTAIFFRDTVLSDLIGFVYSRWKPDKAASHFVQELAKAAAASRQDRPVFTIAMDGENAWEYYLHGGMEFVESLYRKLAQDDRFEMVSPTDVLAENPPLPRLDRVVAGSWIDGTFRTWIGDPVKNTAWEHLLSARTAVAQHLRKNHGGADRAELQDLMMRAEASDWFWWFGKGHSSPYDAEFDQLFRDHLHAIYLKLHMRPPEALSRPLDPENRDAVKCHPPVHLISPRITGLEDGYYKWLSSGYVEAHQGFSHRPEVLIRELRFAFDLQKLYLKVITGTPIRELMEERGVTLQLHFVLPRTRDVAVSLGRRKSVRVASMDPPEVLREADAAAGSVLELSIPLDWLGVPKRKPHTGVVVDLHLVALRKGREVERFPQSSSVVFTVRGEDLDAENWHA